MMTELLRQVVSEIEQLPPQEQDAIAKAIREGIEEREWDARVATPESQRFLERKAAEARAEHAAGKTREVIDSWQGHVQPGSSMSS